MRKVLSFVLVLSLVLGSFSMAFAAAPKDVVGEPSEEAVTVLSDLGVVSGYEDGTYKPENIVTRAEMAVLVIRALGLTDYVTTAAKSSFSDMSGYGWAEGYIAYAQSLGFVSGYPDGTFKPGKTVSYDEAASMLVRALGYSPETLPGTWPANFVVKAKALGLLDGIQAGAAGANRGDVAIILYQTLDQRIGAANKDGEWVDNDTTKDASKPDTMLSRLGAKYIAPKVLTNADAEKASINIKKHLGAYAVTYEKDDKIIAVGEVKSTFLTGKFNAAGTVFTANKVDYSNFTTTTAVDTTLGAVFFNGGDADASDYTTVFAGAGGNIAPSKEITVAVELSGKRVVTLYSVANWEVSDSFLFEKDMLDEESFGSNDFTLNDDDEIDLNSFELLGVASLDKIAEDNVVYVYVGGDDSEITRIEVGTEVVKGKITKTDADGKFYIDGKAYKYDAANGTGAPSVGDTGTALLNYAGEIYDWDVEDASVGNYAMVVKDASNEFEGYKTILFTKAGKEETLVFKNDADGAGVLKDDLATFSTNKDGKINSFTTVEAIAYTSGGALSKSGTIFDGKAVDSGVVVFVYNSSGDYDLGKIADVKKNTELTGATYYAPVGGKVEVLIVPASFAKESTSVYGVLNKIDIGVNDDDDDINVLTGFVGSKALTADTDEQVWAAASKVGDTTAGLYEFEIDSNGVVTKITTGASIATESAVSGTIAAKNGNLVQLDTTTSGIWYSIDSNAVVYQFDDGASAGSKYSVKSTSALKVGQTIFLYQVDEDSEQYDYVIFEK